MRRPRRREVRAVLNEVALTHPPDFDGVRMVGGFTQVSGVSDLDATPASMVLDLMGVHTAADLLAMLRGMSVSNVITVLAWVSGAYETSADDVRACTVIVTDETHSIPPSLLI